MSDVDESQTWNPTLTPFQEALDCESPEDLERWTLEHLEAIDDRFFSILTVLSQMARQEGRPSQADLIQAKAALVHSVADNARAFGQQLGLLESVFRTTTHAERRERLRSILPEITSTFFAILGHWADESNRNGDAAITWCEHLLDLIGFNDLREDWGEPERTIIWGSAWFIQRHVAFRELFDPRNADQPLTHEALRDYLKVALHFAQRGNMASLGLAMLNVILEASPRAGSGLPPVSRADELRFETLVMGAKVIALRGKTNYVANARRVLAEAQTVFERLVATPMDQEDRISMDANAAAMLDISGELALEDGDAEEAVRLHQQALQEHEAIVIRARNEDCSEGFIRSIAWGVPNSLWRLADAEIRLWRLDEACVHFERAIAEYRHWGMQGRDLAGHLQSQAKAEFLHTNFARAEALLDEAVKLRQETEPE